MLTKIPRPRDRRIENGLEVLFRDRFLVHVVDKKPPGALQIDEATEAALGGFFDRCKQLSVDGSGRPWTHRHDGGSPSRKRMITGEELIVEAVRSGRVGERRLKGS
jgi:hypothetical protein